MRNGEQKRNAQVGVCKQGKHQKKYKNITELQRIRKIHFLTRGSFYPMKIALQKSFFYSIISLKRHTFDQIYDLF